jgi:Domain of unknown function (DUF4837)
MKHLKNITLKITLIVTVAITVVACEGINDTILPSITGKSGDLLVVVDSSYWNNQTGEALRETFIQEQKGLPQREAMFNIIQVPRKSFARIFQTNRNIVLVEIKPDESTKISINKDVWSQTQLVATITAPNDKIAAETIRKNATNLLDYFNGKEIERLQKKYKVNAASKKALYLREKLKLSLYLDDLFIVAKEDTNFMWLRKETSVGGHPVSQGFIIYTYPYDNDSIFTSSALISKRNEITKKYVGGGNKGSYMYSYSEYNPIEKEINLNGIYAKELRGLWQMEGDFMGGPYINYSMVDEPRNRVISIDAYVYAPKFDKREYLRELEALALTINF